MPKGWAPSLAACPPAWSYGDMSAHKGYDYRTRTNGEVHIFHGDKLATMLREDDAAVFLDAVKKGDPQEVMAKAVGATDVSRPDVGQTGPGTHLHGNGDPHSPQQFRRKSG